MLQSILRQRAMQTAGAGGPVSPMARMGMQPMMPPENPMREDLRRSLESLGPQVSEYLMGLSSLSQLAPWGTP
jgi:hypothetical protein